MFELPKIQFFENTRAKFRRKKSRMRPLVFSFTPRSHAWYGVAKKISVFSARAIS